MMLIRLAQLPVGVRFLSATTAKTASRAAKPTPATAPASAPAATTASRKKTTAAAPSEASVPSPRKRVVKNAAEPAAAQPSTASKATPAAEGKPATPETRTIPAYATFMKEFTTKNPTLAFAERSKKCAAAWKSLSDAEKQKYEGVTVPYKEKIVRKESALDRFRSEKLKGGGGDLKAIAAEWKSLSAEEKAKYGGTVPSSEPRKRSEWQTFLKSYFEKNKPQQGDAKESFKDIVKRAAAEFKKITANGKA